jgi:uroporphyrinogen-III decarboxylase
MQTGEESEMVDTKMRLYQEREKRVMDAIQLKVPDRVPIAGRYGFFPARYSGITIQEFIYEPEKMWEASWKTMADFPADIVQNPYPNRLLGPLFDLLDAKQVMWPGRQLDPNLSYQFVEGEYMRAEEYPDFISDPSNFIVRRYWPRIFGALRGLGKLLPLHTMTGYSAGVVGTLAAFGLPEVAETLDTLKKAGEEALKVRSYQRRFAEGAKNEGFPLDFGAASYAPFDKLGDYFRGTKGIMLDMYRRPEMVIHACETLLPFMIEGAVAGTAGSGNSRVFIPLHKGADGWMSREQFLKFYWPTLHELMLALIDRGLIPCPFFEGVYTSRLDIIRDIPRGKACYSFETIDMEAAKRMLGGRACIRGNVPGSLMTTGTADDVKRYCRKLIETVGRDGGFILDLATSMDDAKPDNVRAMFDAAGVYGP